MYLPFKNAMNIEEFIPQASTLQGLVPINTFYNKKAAYFLKKSVSHHQIPPPKSAQLLTAQQRCNTKLLLPKGYPKSNNLSPGPAPHLPNSQKFPNNHRSKLHTTRNYHVI